MNKKDMKRMELAFKTKLEEEGKDSNHPSVRAYIRSERKKMKKFRKAGVLDEIQK
jgi:hypothetical protein